MKTLYQLLEEHIEELNIYINELVDWDADETYLFAANERCAALVALREHYNEQ